jgi:succinate-acetate transporter protein
VSNSKGAQVSVPQPASRPAETGGIAAAAALLVARVFGVDDVGVITALAVVIGGVPAVITGIVASRRHDDYPSREIKAANEQVKP